MMKTSAISSSLLLYAASAQGKTKYAGINIAGFDFGCQIDGTCVPSQAYGPVAPGPDGIGQMQHFVKDDNLNIFRLPVGWQYLVNSKLGGTLDATNAANYDKLVQGCLATGASCIIDIHNYARWNNGIIGQGGPTNAQFANLWSQLATKYKSESRIMFGIMNEPHDVPSVTTWAQTVQAVVTAIRQAGASSQMILLPGNSWSAASQFISDGSAAALSTVKNPDGSTTNLIFDVHKYLDQQNSGVGDCVTNNIDGAFAPLATWLRQNKRQAILTETGGPHDSANCKKLLCQQFQYMDSNSDVYLGYVGWGAGSFDTKVDLSEVPTKGSNGVWTDQPLVAACFKR